MHRNGLNYYQDFTERFFDFRDIDPMDETDDMLFPESPETFEEFLKSDEGAVYKRQCEDILKQLAEYAGKNKLDCAPIQEFNKTYLEYSGKEIETNRQYFPIYTESFPALAEIVKLIYHPCINADCAVEIIRHLLTGLGVCVGGAHTHIINAKQELHAQLNLPAHLMQVRKFIAEQEILKLMKRHDIYPGNEIHYVNYLLYIFADQLSIPAPTEKFEPFCSDKIIDQLMRQFRDSLEKITKLPLFLLTLIDQLQLENLPQQLVSDGLDKTLTGLENKLDFYGKEGAQRFYFSDDIVDFKGSDNSPRLHWKARYILQMSLVRRLQLSGYLNIKYKIIAHKGYTIYIPEDQPYSFAYVEVENDPGHKRFQPFYAFCIDELVKCNYSMVRLLQSRKIPMREKYVIVSVIESFLASLSVKKYARYSPALTKEIRKFLPLDAAMQIESDTMLKGYLNTFQTHAELYELSVYAISRPINSGINDLLSAMQIDDAVKFIIYLDTQKIAKIAEFSLLDYAASYGLVDAVIYFLTKKQCPKNVINGALCVAAADGRIAVIKALLNSGQAEVDGENSEHDFPLYLAVRYKETMAVAALLAHGANPDKLAPTGETLLELAVQLNSIGIMRLLVHYNAIIAKSFPDEQTNILHRAARHGDLKLATKVLNTSSSCLLNLKDKKGYHPLHIALCNNSSSLIRLFLARGADVRMHCPQRGTPLTLAVRFCELDTVLTFLEYLREPQDRQALGDTLQIAIDMQNHPVKSALRLHILQISIDCDIGCTRYKVFKKAKENLLEHPESADGIIRLLNALTSIELLSKHRGYASNKQAIDKLLAVIDSIYQCYLADEDYTSLIEKLYLKVKITMRMLQSCLPACMQISIPFFGVNYPELESLIYDLDKSILKFMPLVNIDADTEVDAEPEENKRAKLC